jgi:hypothetical protein
MFMPMRIFCQKGNFLGIYGRAAGLATKPMPKHAQKNVHDAQFFMHDAHVQVGLEGAIPFSGLK